MVDVADDVWPLYMDPGQLDQVLMNLVLNARDAMPGGGTITIQGENVHHPEASDEAAPFVALRIQDTGVGMDEETLSKIFEPFFTTKHEGSGWGLATVHGIVDQSGGSTTVESEPEKGSTFTILLPRAQ